MTYRDRSEETHTYSEKEYTDSLNSKAILK